ncbi:MAG: flagellar motor protein MotA [Alphaproteobacteria bacterium]|nr:flagellar motor protein MotA [Alphaproteobacteria bacterium]
MFRLEPYLKRMAFFLAAVAAVAGLLYPPLARAFMANPALNGLILGILFLGIAYAFRQVVVLRHEAAWITDYRRRQDAHGRPSSMGEDSDIPMPRLLAPMATMLSERQGPLRLTAGSMRSLLDSIASRLDESRALARYLIGLLIFLGLLGTFWGLLLTINSVSGVIGGLKLGSGGDLTDTFARLKEGLTAPLSGMGTAFSSSLFGLAGSLVLGFLDLQTGQAQNRFYNDLEEWLSGLTRLTAPAPAFGGAGGVPDYVQALLEQTAEGLDSLQRILARGEEGRISTSAALTRLAEKLTTLSDQMKAEQALLTKLAQSQMELHPVLERLGAATEGGGFDEASRGHIRNIEVYLARLLEETSTGRRQATEELRSEIKLLARTIAAGSSKAQGRSGS